MLAICSERMPMVVAVVMSARMVTILVRAGFFRPVN